MVGFENYRHVCHKWHYKITKVFFIISYSRKINFNSKYLLFIILLILTNNFLASFIFQAIVVCLDSKDYVQIRNSLIILIKILPHFPVLSKLSQILERKIEKVREEERGHRQDLHILLTSYSGQLKAKSSSMIPESDFHHVGDKVGLELYLRILPISKHLP